MTAKDVKSARLAYGHSITAAAILAGVSRRTWIRWEQGDSPPDPARIDLYRRGIPVENSRKRKIH